MKLIFGKANRKLIHLQEKLGGKLMTFSVLSGVNCPYANICKSQVIETAAGLRIQDGPNTTVRCFSASQEVLFPSVYKARKYNGELIAIASKSVELAVNTILESIPKKTTIIRMFVGGDFKTRNHMRAWIEAAIRRPDILFYGYTKCLPFYVDYMSIFPANFLLTPSMGGKRDDLIHSHGLHYARIVEDENEAAELGLPVDHDDSYAADRTLYGTSFSLLVHNIQKNRKAKYGYGKLHGIKK